MFRGIGKTPTTPQKKIVMTEIDELVVRITKLEKRVAKLERATAPASKNPSVGVYYRDGKPLKRKPKKETEG